MRRIGNRSDRQVLWQRLRRKIPGDEAISRGGFPWDAGAMTLAVLAAPPLASNLMTRLMPSAAEPSITFWFASGLAATGTWMFFGWCARRTRPGKIFEPLRLHAAMAIFAIAGALDGDGAVSKYMGVIGEMVHGYADALLRIFYGIIRPLVGWLPSAIRSISGAVTTVGWMYASYRAGGDLAVRKEERMRSRTCLEEGALSEDGSPSPGREPSPCSQEKLCCCRNCTAAIDSNEEVENNGRQI